jgi:putative alpha-1,2-mannosidase
MVLFDDDHESVSKTLEYAYDWCIAQMAQILNKSDYEYFSVLKIEEFIRLNIL